MTVQQSGTNHATGTHHPELDHVRTWLGQWPAIRSDVEQLLASAVQNTASHDSAPFLVLLDEIETSMRLLQHRVTWLNDLLVQQEQ